MNRWVVAVLLFCLLGTVGARVCAGAPGAQVLSGCADIRKAGLYTLDRDISGSVGFACIQIRDVENVQLDCQGHSITADNSGLAALLVQAAKNFTITSCRLPQLAGYSLFVGDSSSGTITRNVIRDMVVNEPNPANAGSLQVVANQFSEFKAQDPAPAAAPSGDGDRIPVTTGLNQFLARHMVLPEWTEPSVNPGNPPLAVVPPPTPIVYPNPWRADRHGPLPLRFGGLPPNSVIKLFTISAHWVRTLHAAEATTPWDLRNDSGEPVASGTYLYVITADSGQKVVGQFAIIR